MRPSMRFCPIEQRLTPLLQALIRWTLIALDLEVTLEGERSSLRERQFILTRAHHHRKPL